VCVCVCVCVCVWERERERETETETETETERQRQTETDRDRERDREREQRHGDTEAQRLTQRQRHTQRDKGRRKNQSPLFHNCSITSTFLVQVISWLFLLLLDIFFIHISNVVPFPCLPSGKSLSPLHPPAFVKVLPHSPTPSFLLWYSPTLGH
jgi:Flp pilus assembly protein TadB